MPSSFAQTTIDILIREIEKCNETYTTYFNSESFPGLDYAPCDDLLNLRLGLEYETHIPNTNSLSDDSEEAVIATTIKQKLTQAISKVMEDRPECDEAFSIFLDSDVAQHSGQIISHPQYRRENSMRTTFDIFISMTLKNFSYEAFDSFEEAMEAFVEDKTQEWFKNRNPFPDILKEFMLLVNEV